MRKRFLCLVLFLMMACNMTAIAPGSDEIATPGISTIAPEPSSQPVVVNQVPSSLISIEGQSYLAYQNPGDPFRFVCQEPCKVEPVLISAQYTGFRMAYDNMIEVTGIDTIAELQPVDIHVTDDAKCGKLSESPALSYAIGYPPGNAYICSFIFEYAEGFNGQPYSADIAVRLDQQTILVHEYLHTIFFGRLSHLSGALHDFVTPLGLYIGFDWNGDPELCTYHPQTPPGDYGGYLIEQLCQRNGFTLDYLAESLRQLDQLVQSGNGALQEGYTHPVASMAQYRQILNNLLGSDTTAAFKEACWPAQLFGDNYDLPISCLVRTPTIHPTLPP